MCQACLCAEYVLSVLRFRRNVVLTGDTHINLKERSIFWGYLVFFALEGNENTKNEYCFLWYDTVWSGIIVPAVLRNRINLYQTAWRHITHCYALHNHCRRDLPWPWQMVAKFETDAKRENVSHEFNLTRCMKIRCRLKILIWNLINSPQPYWLHIGLTEVDLYVLHHTAFVHLIEFFFACLLACLLALWNVTRRKWKISSDTECIGNCSLDRATCDWGSITLPS